MLIRYKKIIFFCLIAAIGFMMAGFVMVNLAQAQGANNMLWGGQEGNIQAISGLGDRDPVMIVTNIIRIALGFMGIIAVVIIMYGGWLWMTSAGDAQKVDKAKKVLIAAVIGLVIILMSFGIASFILNRLYSATGAGCNPGDIRNCGCNNTGTQICQADETWGVCAPDCDYINGERCCEIWGCCVAGEQCCSFGCAADCSVPPQFYISSTYPRNNDINIIRNAKIRFTFNRRIDESTANSLSFRVSGNTLGNVIGNIVPSSRRVEFTPDPASNSNPTLFECGVNPCGATVCYPVNEIVTVTVDSPGGILSYGDNISIDCNAGEPCIISFTVGDLIDCDDPAVALDFSQICVDPNNELYANSSDDSGIDRIEFFVEGVSLPNGHPLNPSPNNNPIVNIAGVNPFNTFSESLPSYWDGSGYTVGNSINISATAYDVDDNSASDSRNYILRPSYCCNGLLDEIEGELGVDCGGECAACDGAACGISLEDDCVIDGVNCQENNDRCASGLCDCVSPGGTGCQDAGYAGGVNDCCICQSAPIIDWITPWGGFCDDNINTPCQDDSDCGTTCNTDIANGAVGNLVTIGGRFFGDWVDGISLVEFSDGVGGYLTASLASTTNPACQDSWTNTQIIVVVPTGVGANPVIQVTAASNYSDATDDNRGPLVDFVVNSIARPGLCGLNPDNGAMNDLITYYGIKLLNNTAYFGNISSNIEALNSVFTTDLQGTSSVPNLTVGRTTSFVINPQNINSNYLNFTKNSEPVSGPYITSFEPDEGNIGQYVTIYGSGFGNNKSTSEVYFFGTVDVEADYSFPDVCADSVWSDNQIIVKVPNTITLDNNYDIEIRNIPGWSSTVSSNPNIFRASSAAVLLPSLCKIQPIIGPNNSPVKFWGEYFGDRGTGEVKFTRDIFMRGFDSVADPSDPNDNGWIENVPLFDNADYIATSVPQAAITGPVRVVQGGEEGNGMNFTVGLCTDQADPNAACGTQICCPAGTYEEGRCRNIIDDCYSDIPSSVYEWDFSTVIGAGPGDPCYTDFATTPNCSPTSPSCLGNLICDPTDCRCVSTTTPYNSCVERGLITGQCDPVFCPNSPGQCSPYAGGAITTTGVSCADADCDSVGACAAACAYDSNLDRCVDLIQPPLGCDLVSTTLTTDILLNPITAYCADYNGDGHWHIDTPLSCPAGWTSIFGNRCVDATTAPATCALCNSGFVCLNDYDGDYQGVCAVDQDICPSGSYCDEIAGSPTIGECINSDQAMCECCCEIGQDARDCCTPLICDGVCGADTSDDGSGFGLCTGCTVPGDQAASDEACNCSGNSGKFCDVSAGNDDNGDGFPDGVCRDCAQIGTDSTECTIHSTSCCVDNMNSANCRGGFGDTSLDPPSGSIGYCAYFSCAVASPYACDQASSTTGAYNDVDACIAECGTGPPSGFGLSCFQEATTTITCDTSSCSLSCLNDDGSGPAYPDSCGVCCCDPINDLCATINSSYPDLVCQPDMSPCTGGGRGLCCGCEEDLDCGNPPDVGCGIETCCRARPSVSPPTTPPDEADSGSGSGTICRNAVLAAKFDQLMNTGSFSGNVIVVGDYGQDPCPAGTQYLAGGQYNTKRGIAKIFSKIIQTFKNILKPIFGPSKLAKAYTVPQNNYNYCAITGSVSGSFDVGGYSTMEFAPSELLDSDRIYYVIIKGDENLNSSGGVLSYWDIGMNGSSNSPSGPVPADNTFNGIIYTNAYIWSFRTLSDQSSNSGICEIDRVEIDPDSYLFQTTDDDLNEVDTNASDASFDTVADQDKVFMASALSADGQELTPVTGYNWNWAWDIDNPSIVDFDGSSPFANIENKQLIEAQAGITDGNTEIYAEVNLIETNYSSVGDGETGTAEVWVFICENPWPPIVGGRWLPWRDNIGNCTVLDSGCLNTNYELYYCRDAGEFGTADDLPAIVSSSTVIREQSVLSCSVPDPDNDCAAATVGDPCGTGGVCENILKEFYFFREETPDVSSINLTASTTPPAGGAAALYWNNIIPAGGEVLDEYIVYYGISSGSYTDSVSVSLATPYTAANPFIISNLNNGTTYYFAVTAKYVSGAESDYSNEVLDTPLDASAPAAPIIIATSSDAEVELGWSAVSGADSYKVYYGVNSTGPYGYSQNIGSDTAVIIAGLTNGQTYYFVVTAIDIDNNESGYFNEEMTIPFSAPANLIATASSTNNRVIDLNWNLDGAGVNSVNIYQGTASGIYGAPAILSGAPTSYSAAGLIPDTVYYFTIKSENSSGDMSIYSNESSAATIP